MNDGRFNYVEVRFKNGRKDFFSYPNEMRLNEGELVAVEASPGHDIGIVSLIGDAVRLQMKRKNVDMEKKEIRRIFRHARPIDIEKLGTPMAKLFVPSRGSIAKVYSELFSIRPLSSAK